MGLMTGKIACTRMDVVSAPETIDFDQAPFRLLQPGSQLSQSLGFIPFESGEPYQLGADRQAFRVRIDTLQVDATLLRERTKELVKIESEQVGRPSLKRVRQLKDQAEEELRATQSPKTKIIECVIDAHVLYIGTTSKQVLGTIVGLLRQVGVSLEFKTPWIERGEEIEPPAHIKLRDPAQSILGCRFLRHLLQQEGVFLEAQRGLVKLITTDGGEVTLRGAVSRHFHRFVAEEAEVLSAKLIIDDAAFQFDGFAYRISGLTLTEQKEGHWTERLGLRLDQLVEVWDVLDRHYASWTK